MPDEVDCFRVRITDRGETVVVAVTGEIDLSTAPVLRTRFDDILADEPSEVVLDTSAAPFIDSAGIAAVLACHRELAGRGGRLCLGPMSPTVERVLSVAGVLDQLPRSGKGPVDG